MITLAIITGIICAIIGFMIGREGALEDQCWRGCKFIGKPPRGYTNWHEWKRARVKDKATISAS